MNKEFDNIDKLIEEVKRDKAADGANSSMLNRYPVRFVLFDNFADSKLFVNELIGLDVTKMQKIVDWMDKDYPDLMMTYSSLSTHIKRYVEDNSDYDCIIVPFSELARFYNNNEAKEFEALVCDIKGIQSTVAGFNRKQRIYIPMIGQYGKMSRFFSDSQSVIWHLAGTSQDGGFHLTLTPSTFNVKGLENDFTIVPTITDWMKVWRDDKANTELISTSKSIYALADNAQPDNALSYSVCHNAYEFLTKGLGLFFGEIRYREEDACHWEKLAGEIEYKDFSFEKFFNKYFDIFDLSDYTVFVKTWFENPERFNRWLLATYYTKRFCDEGYICHLLRGCRMYSNKEFVSSAVLSVFDMDHPEDNLDERAVIITYAQKNNIQLSEDDSNKLCKKLKECAIEKGYAKAMLYVAGLSDKEKELIVNWVANGHIAINMVAKLYPELSCYMESYSDMLPSDRKWVLEYIDAYRWAKLSNKYTETIGSFIGEKNANEVTFNSWYNRFSTVSTLLNECNDIDVFYWIDGLGVDWIPFIIHSIAQYKNEGIFLNDIMIGRALLPSTTEINKLSLQKLADGNLSKKGDLDGFAHKCTSYPQYIIEEFKIVETAIREIVSEHAGKKIAIISDHGLSYLSQLRQGYNLGGIKSNHCGRCAIHMGDSVTHDDKYIILDDGRTLCSLRHESLAAKIADGQGCHGGCTPEEVLVPIFILSSQCHASEYTISLVDNEVSGSNPVLAFRIKGVSGFDTPKLIYDNIGYNLNSEGNNRFGSDRIALKENVDEVEVRIGDFSQKFKIKINLGAEEEDLFDM